MEIVHRPQRYVKDSKWQFKDDYDFLLFRQDFNGNESVYFNLDEEKDVNHKIQDGEILLNISYSILIARDQAMLDKLRVLRGMIVTTVLPKEVDKDAKRGPDRS